MNCPQCGKPVEDTSKFCEFCGASLNESRLKDCKTVDVSSENHKNAGTIVKRMWIISIFAIIAIIITHIVAMVPIQNKAERISEEWNDHNYTENGTYAPCDREECSECISYKTAQESNNQQGALQWQNTVTYCTLIAFAGAIVYGIGTIAEETSKDWQKDRN